MQFEIVGIEVLSYTSKKTGLPVRGTNLYLLVHEENPRVNGQRTEKLYCKETIYCSQFSLGDMVKVYYNRWGNAESVVPA